MVTNTFDFLVHLMEQEDDDGEIVILLIVHLGFVRF